MNTLAAAAASGVDLLNSTYDIVFIAATIIGGGWGAARVIIRALGKRFDKQDGVLDLIMGTLSDHHVRIAKAETRLDAHDQILYLRRDHDETI